MARLCLNPRLPTYQAMGVQILPSDLRRQHGFQSAPLARELKGIRRYPRRSFQVRWAATLGSSGREPQIGPLLPTRSSPHVTIGLRLTNNTETCREGAYGEWQLSINEIWAAAMTFRTTAGNPCSSKALRLFRKPRRA
ncbi:hypothetical protein L1887_59133 [Cichorium endivia]|nr:hypothetical protein L1887_59133 [Cichorium endivia]